MKRFRRVDIFDGKGELPREGTDLFAIAMQQAHDERARTMRAMIYLTKRRVRRLGRIRWRRGALEFMLPARLIRA